MPPTQVAEWAGHSLDVLLRIYAKCLIGQDELARRRIAYALHETNGVGPNTDSSRSDTERADMPHRTVIVPYQDGQGWTWECAPCGMSGRRYATREEAEAGAADHRTSTPPPS